MTAPRPHDLLRITSAAQLGRTGPHWVRAALHAAPWVVVRRARCAPGYLPVGIRGRGRSRRHATDIESSCIAEVLRPTDLVRRIDQLPDIAAKDTLAEVTALLTPTGMCWGPGGSVGYTLATGVCAVKPSSDLDVVLTVDEVPPLALLAELRQSFRRLPARVDCQLDLPIGGIALDDLLGPADMVLVRTADGPVLQNLCREAS
ncbi:malonate decarboxylase holo-[acyl-carrier-protein] synthase [Mycobacterium sp. ACS1612]|uniref:malonate decarboxylase holo-ACP synthase n=1 Tax=Mycobacterium sp. ACS1612 TaxID=1834117 RepID=UPI0007FC3DE9|nr:malonate decarboxylase holo-ACP synthase [Mycobacterium sp. ACS1612]OBF33730.1 malonate decarboxylase holo-[acyl-carrier-protein] synthase [Mycobacterium sp. ACS1612]